MSSRAVRRYPLFDIKSMPKWVIYESGKIHRLDGPAVIREPPAYTTRMFEMAFDNIGWRDNKPIHREDGPAVIREPLLSKI